MGQGLRTDGAGSRGCRPSAFAQDDDADELLGRDPLALVLGMLLDQHMRQRSSVIRRPYRSMRPAYTPHGLWRADRTRRADTADPSPGTGATPESAGTATSRPMQPADPLQCARLPRGGEAPG